MKNKFKLDDTLIYSCTEFDGKVNIVCKVTEIYNDHLIAVGDGMHLWIDKDTEYMFKKI